MAVGLYTGVGVMSKSDIHIRYILDIGFEGLEEE